MKQVMGHDSNPKKAAFGESVWNRKQINPQCINERTEQNEQQVLNGLLHL